MAAPSAGDDPQERTQKTVSDDDAEDRFVHHRDQHAVKDDPLEALAVQRIALDALRVQLDLERGRVEQADRAAAQLGKLWETAVQARHQAEAALVIARAGQQAAEAMIAQLQGDDEARRARGLLVRLWQVL